MQQGFDFTGFREQLGAGFDKFVDEWQQLQLLLAGRGRAILPAGRILTAMLERYREEVVWQMIRQNKAPTVTRARNLMSAWAFFGDKALSDTQAAVLDELIDKRMRDNVRHYAFGQVLNDKSAQEILDVVDAMRPPPRTPEATITEAEVRDAYAALLQADGWHTRLEQATLDGGAVDIVAEKPGELLICECKVALDRATAYDALGQLTVYSHTYRGAAWHVAYWKLEASAEKLVEVFDGDDALRFKQVAMRKATA